MGYYAILKSSLADEMVGDKAYSLAMSRNTYNKLMTDPDFAAKVTDGGVLYPDINFVWFEDARGAFVFSISYDEALPTGQVDSREVDGEKPTIHFS